MNNTEVIEVERIDSLEWSNLRLASIVKRTEASALRSQADATDLVAVQFEQRADALLSKIQTEMGIAPDYEPVVKNNRLIFQHKP